MARSSADMVRNVREILHDAGRSTATSNVFYDTDEIVARLNDAKERTGKALLRLQSNVHPSKFKYGMLEEPPISASAAPALVTSAKLWKTVSASDGGAVPSDFAAGVGGLRSDNGYLPWGPIATADAMQQSGHDVCFVRAGAWRLPQSSPTATVLYAARASEVISGTSNRTLTEFPDGVYDAIELLAARELVAKEESDAADRWQVLTQMYLRSIATFN